MSLDPTPPISQFRPCACLEEFPSLAAESTAQQGVRAQQSKAVETERDQGFDILWVDVWSVGQAGQGYSGKSPA